MDSKTLRKKFVDFFNNAREGLTGQREDNASFIDEAPTWSPNGRVLMFFRVSSGAKGAPQIYSVDVTGRNMHMVPTPSFASDPAWSGLLK